MLDTPRSEVVRRELATYFIRQFPIHFPSRTSPCAITFQLDSNTTLKSTQLSLDIFGGKFEQLNTGIKWLFSFLFTVGNLLKIEAKHEK
jgi:hypothetical protein